MNKCTNCGYTTDNNINFCPMCGGKVEAEAPVCQDVEVISTYEAPVQRPSKGKIIAGMAIAIESFAAAIILFLYALPITFVQPVAGLIYGLVTAFINLPLAIVGLVLSKDTTEGRDTPIFCRLGKIFGTISVILTCIILILPLLVMIGWLFTRV